MWLEILLAGFILLALFVTFTLVFGRIMIQRRKPDPADNPGNHGIAYEDVEFESRYKATIRGWWIPGKEPSKGTIVFCHGQNGSMEGDLPIAVRLYPAGYNILMFNLRAHGTSTGDKLTFGVFEKDDLLGALDFLEKTKEIKEVAVIGFSMGAAVGMIGAALTPRIKTLILDGVFLRFMDTIEAYVRQVGVPPILSTGITYMTVLGASLWTNTRMYQVSPMLWARHIEQNVPVLFIHAEKDEFAPETAIKRLAEDVQGTHEVWVAPDCKHREAFQKHPDEYIRRVLDWLASYYAPQSPKG